VPDSELTKETIDIGDFWTIYDPKRDLYLMCQHNNTKQPIILTFDSEDKVIEFMNRYNVPNTMEPKYVPRRVFNE
jgi:hypothetical protein